MLPEPLQATQVVQQLTGRATYELERANRGKETREKADEMLESVRALRTGNAYRTVLVDRGRMDFIAMGARLDTGEDPVTGGTRRHSLPYRGSVGRVFADRPAKKAAVSTRDREHRSNVDRVRCDGR